MFFTLISTLMPKINKEDKTLVRVLIIGCSKKQTAAIQKIICAEYAIKLGKVQEDKEAIKSLKQYIWDIVLVPVNNATAESIQLYSELAMKKASTPLLAIADDVSCRSALQAMAMGARDIVYPGEAERFLFILQRELNDTNARRNHIITQSRYNAHKRAAQNEKNSSNHTQYISPESTSKKLSDIQNNKYDLTTNLYSQQYFMAELSHRLSVIDQAKRKYALLYFDFQAMDDLRATLGINASNSLLVEIAIIMQDNIGHMGPIARLSNQVYVVLASFTNMEDLQLVLDNTRSLINRHMHISMPSLLPESSAVNIGMCMLNTFHGDAYHLMTKAGYACRIATKSSKTYLHIFNPEIDSIDNLEASQILQNWEKQIRSALLDNRFKVVFQMIRKLESSGVENYELLFRMIDKISGADIMPGEFLVTADQTGLIVIIDQWVTGQAMKMVVEDKEQGRKGNYFIKLSNRTVNSNTFIPWLMEGLKKHDASNNRLVFEIDKTELIKRPIELQTFIRTIKSLNCRVALEYFGTQRNQLSILEQFDVDFIKLDRSLTHCVVTEPERVDHIKTIVRLANDANIEVIAEFIEDAKTLSVIFNAGVTYIQGHFVQQPDSNLDTNVS